MEHFWAVLQSLLILGCTEHQQPSNIPRVPPAGRDTAFQTATHRAIIITVCVGRNKASPQPLPAALSGKGVFNQLSTLWSRSSTPRALKEHANSCNSLQTVQNNSWTRLCSLAVLIITSASSLLPLLVLASPPIPSPAAFSLHPSSLSQLCVENSMFSTLALIWSAKLSSISHRVCIRKIDADKFCSPTYRCGSNPRMLARFIQCQTRMQPSKKPSYFCE